MNCSKYPEWTSTGPRPLIVLRCIGSVLCGDLTYVILFPQLLLVLYFPPSNTYGSVASFLVR